LRFEHVRDPGDDTYRRAVVGEDEIEADDAPDREHRLRDHEQAAAADVLGVRHHELVERVVLDSQLGLDASVGTSIGKVKVDDCPAVETRVETRVAAGDDDAARTSLGRIDWILRGRARRRLENALTDASLATGILGDDPEATRHRLRAAALIVQGRDDCDLADRDGITAAYAGVAPCAPARWPVATIVCAIAAVAITVGVASAAIKIVTTTDPGAAYLRPFPPPPVGAFREGGVPMRDPMIEHVLAVELPGLVDHPVADEDGRHRVATVLRDHPRDHPAFATHGPALATAWRDMIDGIDRWMDLDSTDRTFRAMSTELRARVDVASDQLAAARLGYYLDPEILAEHSRRRTGIYAYRVDEVAFVRTNDERVRVLGVRRLDHLEDVVTLLGLTTEELHDSVVVLDQIDEKVRSQILLVLTGGGYPLGDDAWGRSRGRAIAVAAGDAIRRELVIALGTDASSLELATVRCRNLITASVRHHEAQHGYDHDRDLRLPAALAEHVGEASSAFAVRSRYELSAYLGQIASDIWLPQLTLWNLSRHAFRGSNKRIEEAYVAVVIVEGLARQLHIESAGPVFHNGALDRDRLAALVGPIAARSTTELRSAAAKLWADLFDQHLVRIVDE